MKGTNCIVKKVLSNIYEYIYIYIYIYIYTFFKVNLEKYIFYMSCGASIRGCEELEYLWVKIDKKDRKE